VWVGRDSSSLRLRAWALHTKYSHLLAFYSRPSNPFLSSTTNFIPSQKENKIMWVGRDSNPRRPKPTGLQPVVIDHSTTYPNRTYALKFSIFNLKLPIMSRLSDLNSCLPVGRDDLFTPHHFTRILESQRSESNRRLYPTPNDFEPTVRFELLPAGRQGRPIYPTPFYQNFSEPAVGIEPTTYSLQNYCSNQLSYAGKMVWGE
jgi:hypothetical protein